MDRFTMRTGDDNLLDVVREEDVLVISIAETHNKRIGMTAEIRYDDFIKLLTLLEK